MGNDRTGGGGETAQVLDAAGRNLARADERLHALLAAARLAARERSRRTATTARPAAR